MCSAPPSLRRSIDGMQIKLRSCSKMKSPIHFRSRSIFLHGENGRLTWNGCDIAENSSDRLALEELGHFQSPEFQGRKVFSEESLNSFLALGRPAWRKTREVLQHLLAADAPILRDDPVIRGRVFHAQGDVVMKLPARIGNYTDFYSSYHHAHNVGTMLRGPENALMPNRKWLHMAYHGRASTVAISGTDRP